VISGQENSLQIIVEAATQFRLLQSPSPLLHQAFFDGCFHEGKAGFNGQTGAIRKRLFVDWLGKAKAVEEKLEQSVPLIQITGFRSPVPGFARRQVSLRMQMPGEADDPVLTRDS
jgi:hypothetical protein